MHAYNANQGSYDYYNNELEGEFDSQAVRFKPEPIETLLKLTKFDRRELKLIYRGFKELCPLGVVKEDKFKLIYAQFFPRSADTNNYGKYLFNSFDVHRKQEITFTDFVIRLSILIRGTKEDKIRWIFSLYDINNDGIITQAEFCRILGSIHDLVGRPVQHSSNNKSDPCNSLRRQTNKNVLVRQQSVQTTSIINNHTDQINDLNAQNLSLEECQRAQEAEQLFKKFDLNNDGIITQDEFLEACTKDPNIMKSLEIFNTII